MNFVNNFLLKHLIRRSFQKACDVDVENVFKQLFYVPIISKLQFTCKLVLCRSNFCLEHALAKHVIFFLI